VKMKNPEAPAVRREAETDHLPGQAAGSRMSIKVNRS
jgi:hypothetical protein